MAVCGVPRDQRRGHPEVHLVRHEEPGLQGRGVKAGRGWDPVWVRGGGELSGGAEVWVWHDRGERGGTGGGGTGAQVWPGSCLARAKSERFG